VIAMQRLFASCLTCLIVLALFPLAAAAKAPQIFTSDPADLAQAKEKFRAGDDKTRAGTTYQVSRRIGTSGSFSIIGGSGIRSFTDNTLPSPLSSVTYQIQAVRSTAVGTAAQFTVNFGTGAAGEVTAFVTAAPKLAA
jgi:hypothetical protein